MIWNFVDHSGNLVKNYIPLWLPPDEAVEELLQSLSMSLVGVVEVCQKPRPDCNEDSSRIVLQMSVGCVADYDTNIKGFSQDTQVEPSSCCVRIARGAEGLIQADAVRKCDIALLKEVS